MFRDAQIGTSVLRASTKRARVPEFDWLPFGASTSAFLLSHLLITHPSSLSTFSSIQPPQPIISNWLDKYKQAIYMQDDGILLLFPLSSFLFPFPLSLSLFPLASSLFPLSSQSETPSPSPLPYHNIQSRFSGFDRHTPHMSGVHAGGRAEIDRVIYIQSRSTRATGDVIHEH